MRKERSESAKRSEQSKEVIETLSQTGPANNRSFSNFAAERPSKSRNAADRTTISSKGPCKFRGRRRVVVSHHHCRKFWRSRKCRIYTRPKEANRATTEGRGKSEKGAATNYPARIGSRRVQEKAATTHSGTGTEAERNPEAPTNCSSQGKGGTPEKEGRRKASYRVAVCIPQPPKL